MQSLVECLPFAPSPECLLEALPDEPGRLLLRSAAFEFPQARYSLVVARPFLVLRSSGSRCDLFRPSAPIDVRFGNPWRLLDLLLARYEILDAVDHPFPLGGAFGFWGYDLRVFVEPHLRRRAPYADGLPDSWIGFYDSLAVIDHRAGHTFLVATGLLPDGSRCPRAARTALDRWRRHLDRAASTGLASPSPVRPTADGATLRSNFTREAYCGAVRKAQQYIRAGDIYQVNLAQKLTAGGIGAAWPLWRRLAELAPAPFSAFLDAGDFQIASLSPELFLRFSGDHVITRPIKGTRPRAADPAEDARLTYELQTSPKEIAELVMITDLLRNDLGRVCEYGSIQVPDLLRLERHPQVQHLVSTIEGRLRPGLTHLAALESCFPGGSITGAPKIRAMEVIDELEPEARGPYTGCAGYLGFNRESQMNILIRTAVVQGSQANFHAGAGIVADSDPQAEYEETLVKARAFLQMVSPPEPSLRTPAPP